MILRNGIDNYEEIAYSIDASNYIFMDKEINIKEIFKDEDFLNRLINLIIAEKKAWGRKEVYLTFEDIERLIRSAKNIYDIYDYDDDTGPPF